MIKFDTQLGAEHLNAEARLHKELMKPKVKGMRCMKCQGVDTFISFFEASESGINPLAKVNFLKYRIIACCQDFKIKLETKLKKE